MIPSSAIIGVVACAAAISLISAITAAIESFRKRSDHEMTVILVDDQTESYNIPPSRAGTVRDVVAHEASVRLR